jgi:hypothetical protein
MKNMSAKVISLQFKCDETVKKTKDIEKKKEDLIKEIQDIKDKFALAVEQYKRKTEYKNELLDKHISELNDDYTKKEIEIEGILRNFDIVAGRESNLEIEEMDGNENGDITNKPVFGRQMVMKIMENVRTTLYTKTQHIKSLKYSLALATKVIIILNFLILFRLTMTL